MNRRSINKKEVVAPSVIEPTEEQLRDAEILLESVKNEVNWVSCYTLEDYVSEARACLLGGITKERVILSLRKQLPWYSFQEALKHLNELTT